MITLSTWSSSMNVGCCNSVAFLFIHLILLISKKFTAQRFLEERMEVGYGYQSQQWKYFVQIEAFYYLALLSHFLQFLPISYCLAQQPSGLWCSDGNREEGIAGYLNLGDGPKLPFSISDFLLNITYRNMCAYTIGSGSRNQGTPMKVSGSPQKTRHSATAHILTLFYTGENLGSRRTNTILNLLNYLQGR